MQDKSHILTIILLLIFLICIFTPVKTSQTCENIQNDKFAGFRKINNPIGIYVSSIPYTGIWPNQRYYPEFKTEFEENMESCIESCSKQKNSQECIKHCEELYPSNQYTIY